MVGALCKDDEQGEATDRRLKLFVSTPFRTYGDAGYYPDALFGVGEQAKERYVRALVREIEAASEGMDEFLVDEIEFGNGPASSLATPLLMDVMRAIRKNYRLATDVCIHATEIPGGLSVDYAGFCKNIGMSFLEVEMLSSDVMALRAHGLPPTYEGTVNDYQIVYFTGGPRLGILLDASLDCDERSQRRSAADALGRSPLFVRVVGSNGCPAVMREAFAGRGMTESTPGLFASAGFEGIPKNTPEAHINQLGFGVNSLSRFDGITFKTTGSLALYTAQSTDFAVIAKQM